MREMEQVMEQKVTRLRRFEAEVVDAENALSAINRKTAQPKPTSNSHSRNLQPQSQPAQAPHVPPSAFVPSYGQQQNCGPQQNAGPGPVAHGHTASSYGPGPSPPPQQQQQPSYGQHPGPGPHRGSQQQGPPSNYAPGPSPQQGSHPGPGPQQPPQG